MKIKFMIEVELDVAPGIDVEELARDASEALDAAVEGAIAELGDDVDQDTSFFRGTLTTSPTFRIVREGEK